MEQKQKSHIRPIVYVMISVFLIIGYAYLTSSLTINGSTLLKKATWDVHFENVQVKDGSVTGDQVTQEPEIDSEQTTVSFHVNLKKPGDYYEFTVDAVNAGTIDAMINTYTEFDLTEDQLKYLETSVTYEDGEEIAEKQQLLAGDFAIFKIIVSFKKDLEASDLPSNPEQLDLEFTVEYVQKDDTAIERLAETNSLYNVLKRETESGSGLAKLYIGEHQDSMDSSKSTRGIYHWYGQNNSKGQEIVEKNNVIFAGYCWQMIRTTDTGGVRLIYNGEVANNKCLNDREDHLGLKNASTKNLKNQSYYYSSSYTFSNSDNLYYLSNDKFLGRYNDFNDVSLLTGKYTCLSSNADSSCTELYYVDSLQSDTYGNLYMLGPLPYSVVDYYKFNSNENDISSVGYQTGDSFLMNDGSIKKEHTLLKSNYLISKETFNSEYYIADSYNEIMNGMVLANPYRISQLSNYDDMIGKYTVFETKVLSNVSYSQLSYIVAYDEDYIYYMWVTEASPVSSKEPLVIGNSFTDNNDGTYTITNPIYITYNEWFNNYSNYVGKYISNTRTAICDNPHYIVSTTNVRYYYTYAKEKISISSEKNGLTLTNPLILTEYEFLTNSPNSSNYRFMCYSDDGHCTFDSLQYYIGINSDKYIYLENRKFGGSVSWNGTKYTLNDIKDIEVYKDLELFSTHHFTCFNEKGDSCTKVAYITNAEISIYPYLRHFYLENGITTISSVFESAFRNNSNDSLMKKHLESWYSKHLSNYSSFLEDTIYCNDRTIKDLGGWAYGGGNINQQKLEFNQYFLYDPVSGTAGRNLKCSNVYDSFSTNNSLAHLNYSIGLLSVPELYLLNNTYVLSSPTGYWLITPADIHTNNAYMKFAYDVNYASSHNWLSNHVFSSGRSGVRPVISLKPGTIYLSGDGSMENPYVIDTD